MDIDRIKRQLSAVPKLVESLKYWLPDETMIPRGHEGAWHRAVEALQEFDDE